MEPPIEIAVPMFHRTFQIGFRALPSLSMVSLNFVVLHITKRG